MGHCYSLVHLTNLACPPPEFIRVAARAGYDAVSLRTIPLGLPGEQPYDMTKDPQLLRETRRAVMGHTKRNWGTLKEAVLSAIKRYLNRNNWTQNRISMHSGPPHS